MFRVPVYLTAKSDENFKRDYYFVFPIEIHTRRTRARESRGVHDAITKKIKNKPFDRLPRY